MHVLYIHKAFPPQFAPLARALARTVGWKNTFLSRKPDQTLEELTNIQYDAPEQEEKAWDCAFAQQLQHSIGVAEAVRRHRLKPDLVVAHSGFGSSHLLPSRLECPVINYFEYFTKPLCNDLLERREWRHPTWYYDWRRTANAMTLLDLQACNSGYSPTQWQRSTFPIEYQQKINVLFDGVDTATFTPRPEKVVRRFRDLEIASNTRVVTYVARGLEAVRGFDIFMQVAKRIYTVLPDTIFLVAGKDRVCYGTDLELVGRESFKQWVLEQDDYDLSKFHFLDWLPVEELVQLFHLSDLHIYLTTPFVLSWSLFNALACGTTVLASDVEPVREVVRDGVNGLLADLHDRDALAARALEVLADPRAVHSLGQKAALEIEANYSMNFMLPKFLRYFSEIAAR
ncbi:MAG TPA: glycosyltransferase [Chthoniobacteraceae bacterium]|nr:glycosyltransferase [Chthoniobacteraceae bacterium]